MNDLISRQAAIDAIMELVNLDTVEELRDHCKERLCTYWSDGILDAIDAISVMPSADVQPVVHGEWIKTMEGNAFRDKCSECESLYPNAFGYNWCPNCGADMRGEGGK